MKRLLSIFMIFSLFLAGCGENETIHYEGEPDGTSGICFAYYEETALSASSITYKYIDTTRNYNMLDVTGDSYQVIIPVRLFGNVSETDRPFTVKKTGGTAEEGKDFTLPKEMFIPKGKASANVVVRIKKTDELQDGAVRYITLGLEENEYFKPYIKEHIIGYDTVNAQSITIRYSVTLKEPSNWKYFGVDQLGAYSPAKLTFLLEIMGWTYSEFPNNKLSTTASTLAMFAKIELQKRADEGNPVRESDGSLMQLAGNNLVDYSAYE